MPQNSLLVQLSSLHGGAYTQVKVKGVFPTALPEQALLHLTRGISLVTGYPVTCVLFVESQAMGWCGWWLDHLALIPERHLEVQCVRKTAGVEVFDEL